MNELEECRKKIDKIDREIIELLGQRKAVVEVIAEIKKKNGLDALQPARFREVIEMRRLLAAEANLDPEMVEEIWNVMHDHFVKLESKLI